MRPQHGEGFKQGDRDLARRLGLTSQWWTVNSVLDRSAAPCHPRAWSPTMTGTRVAGCGLALLDAVARERVQALQCER